MQNNRKWMRELKKERSLSIRQSYFRISKLRIKQISNKWRLLRNKKMQKLLTKRLKNIKNKRRMPNNRSLQKIRTTLKM